MHNLCKVTIMPYYLTIISLCLPLILAHPSGLEVVSNSSKSFAAFVYEQAALTESGNFLFSSASAQNVLALTLTGATGATADELRTVLHLPDSLAEIEAGFTALNEILTRKNDYQFLAANNIFVRKGFAIKKEFSSIAAHVFDSRAETIDFSQNDRAVAAINMWVAAQTDRKISSIIKGDDLKVDTRLVLVNAMHLRANWSGGFAHTTDAFFVQDRKAISVDTLFALAERSYCENRELDAKFVELPLEGDGLTLTVVLPNRKDGLSALESRMEEVLRTPNYTEEMVKIAVPTFKAVTTLDLSHILQMLGARRMFTNVAELGGIAEIPKRGGASKAEKLKVDKVVQKSSIAVNENGVDGLAAVEKASVLRPWALNRKPVREIKADHPFIYYIKLQDVIMFVGRVADPSK